MRPEGIDWLFIIAYVVLLFAYLVTSWLQSLRIRGKNRVIQAQCEYLNKILSAKPNMVLRAVGKVREDIDEFMRKSRSVLPKGTRNTGGS